MKMTDAIRNLLNENPYLYHVLPETIAQHNLGNQGETTESDYRTGNALEVKVSSWNLTREIRVLIVTLPGCDIPQLLLPGEYAQIDSSIGDLR